MIHNLLHEFFNSKSDANKYLTAEQQEDLEKDFQEWSDEKSKDFEHSARPLIRYLAENHHPHHTAIVTSDRVELLEGQKSYITEDYIVD